MMRGRVMNIPKAFSREHVEANSGREHQPFREFLRSGEPYRSMLEHNPWLQPPDLSQPLAFGVGRYWDTTTARAHPFWRDYDLPLATQDIHRLRRDFVQWGYCLIQDGLSPNQCDAFLCRLHEQAEGERLAGVQQDTPYGQYVNTLINKGPMFAGCITQDPEYVQAGPLIEQLIHDTLGPGWICHSFLANGADPGGYPQGLHIDQGPLAPWLTEQAPALVNTMYIPQAVNDRNGGTLLIPGSHNKLIAAGSGGKVGKLPPTINLEADAGTIMIFDGRLLHGTGANRTDRRRFVVTMSNVKPWMRTQENWVISTAPDVLANASPKLLHRLGLQALTYGSTVEGFGLSARGRVGDPWGAIRQFRDAIDQGSYERVRMLSPESSQQDLNRPYTVAQAMTAAKKAPLTEPGS